MTSTEKVKKLGFQRQVPYSRLKEMFEFCDKTNLPDFNEQFLVRSQDLDDIYQEFKRIHNSIISLLASDEDFNEQDSVRRDADSYYYSVKAKKSKIESLLASNFPKVSEPPKAAAKLPKISIPTFDGNFKMWPSFFDLFNSVVHDNKSLSQVEKFHFLMTSLDKEPFSLLKGIPMTENNYMIAYDTLKKRYQNVRFFGDELF